MKWHEYYSKEITLKDYLGHLSTHATLFEFIIEQKPRKILEIGTGTGSMSIFLSHLGYEVVSIDNNEKVLERAKKLSDTLLGRVKFLLCDAFKLGNKFKASNFDVVFSHGFLEHFDRGEIEALIKEQLKVGKVVFFSVPSKYHVTKEFGDERLWGIEEWTKILSSFNLELIRYYGPPGVKRMIKQLIRFPYPPLRKPQYVLGKILG